MKITSVEFIKSATIPEHYPDDILPEVAFAGRSNVGKSSLINMLLGRKRLARTSNTPGRTQLINFFSVNNKLFLVDLPGYGYAKVPAAVRKNWGLMIEKYLKGRRNLCLVIVILDIRRIPSKDDISLIEWLHCNRISIRFVLTKADKLSRNQIIQNCRKIKESLQITDNDLIIFSAKTGYGKDDIWKSVACATGTKLD